MADSPIHDLPAASSVAGSDVVPIDQGNTTRRATMTQVSQAVGPINVGVSIHNANSKTTPIDPDEFGLVDTADGNTLKKVTWANIKATLLTYFSALTGLWNISTNGNAATSSTLLNADDTTTNATMYPLWTTTVGGNYAAKVSSTKLTFSPSTGILTATGFAGLLTGNASTATALQTARTIDGTSFNGTANITVIAPGIHAATNKTTPVDADEIGIWDSVSGLLTKLTWANLKTTLGNTFAALAGLSTQVFSVAAGTSGVHAARVDQISLMPTVNSATSPDIFGAAGATINYDNSTPVTATSIAACATAQIGSKKIIIPTADANFTASANLVIDGQTSGTYIMPANAIIEVVPVTTTKFIITTIHASGTWTPNEGAGLTVVGTFSSSGKWVKRGNSITVTGHLAGSTSIAFTAATPITSNAPFSTTTVGMGTVGNEAGTSSCGASIISTTIYGFAAMSATPSIDLTMTYIIP